MTRLSARAAAFLTAGTVVALAASPATAATYVYFAPLNVATGGASAEAYVPQTFEAHEGLSGSALVDAALKELRQVLGESATSIKTSQKGTQLSVTMDGPAKLQAGVVDRALGAIFHTARMAGATEVSFDGRTLTGDSFSRGALVPVFGLTSALPPSKLAHGYVRVGASVVPAASFYQRLASGDAAIQQAGLALFQSGTSAAKLRLVEAVDALRLPDRDGALIALLQDKDSQVRLAALDVFKGTRRPPVLSALEAIVDKDNDADVKIAAVKILVGAGKSNFKKYLLLEKLKSDDASVVLSAAQSLASGKDPKFAAAFVSLSTHGNPEVRKVAVEGLASLKLYELMASVLTDKDPPADTAEPLAEHLVKGAAGMSKTTGLNWLLAKGAAAKAVGAAKHVAEKSVVGAVSGLAAALKRSETEVRLAAAATLAELKDTAGLEPLAEALRNAPDAEERSAMTDAGIAIVSRQPLGQVITISKSEDATVRELAIKAMAAFSKDRPNPRVVGELKTHLKASEPGIRRAAVFALARIKDEGIVAELVALKDDKDEEIRAQVAYALTPSKHPQADEILRSYLDDGANDVKLQAVIAVKQRKITDAFSKIRMMIGYRHLAIRRAVMEAVLVLSKPADPALFDLFSQQIGDSDPKVRILAIDGLAAYTVDQRTAGAIGGAMIGDDATVKIHALKILSTLQDPNAVFEVIRGLFDETKEVKMAALDALEALKNEKASKALQEFITNTTDKDVRKRATEVLDTL